MAVSMLTEPLSDTLHCTLYTALAAVHCTGVLHISHLYALTPAPGDQSLHSDSRGTGHGSYLKIYHSGFIYLGSTYNYYKTDEESEQSAFSLSLATFTCILNNLVTH